MVHLHESEKANGKVTVSFALEKEEPVNIKENLQKLYEEKQDISKEGYTSASWKTFEEALATVKEVLEDPDATAEDVQGAAEELDRAERGLTLAAPTDSKEPPKQEMPAESKEQSKQDTVKVRSIRLNGDVTKLAKGKKILLKADVLPVGASNKNLKWTSSNKKAASVNAEGIVTGRGKGTTTITAAATDGSGKKGTFKITVVPHAVKKISLKSSIKTVAAGKKATIKAIVSTTGKTANKKLEWTTSNKKYATVNSKGVVTARKAGKGKAVLITAKATDGSGKKAAIRIKIK